MIEVWFLTCQNFVLYNFRSVSEFISAMNGTENLETKEEEAERIHFQKVMEQPESSKNASMYKVSHKNVLKRFFP